MMSGRSVLVLGSHQWRRLAASASFQDDGAVVVEAATVYQADAILRQFRFDVLAIDLFGFEVGVLRLLDGLGVDHPGMCVAIIGATVDTDELVRFHATALPNRRSAFSEGRIGAGDAMYGCESDSGPRDDVARIRRAAQQE